MHLLATTAGAIDDGSQALDLGQTPGDVVVLSAAESELACLAAAHARLRALPAGQAPAGGWPSLRLASLNLLGHHLSVDLYVDAVIRQARLVVVRLLGGRSYWPYGVDEISAACRKRGIPLVLLPGDDRPDSDLLASSTVDSARYHRLWHYLIHGGVDNAEQLLRHTCEMLGCTPVPSWQEPAPLAPAGLWGADQSALTDTGKPVALVVFYRALVQAANTAVVEALCDALRAEGLAPLALYVTSLKDPLASALAEQVVADARPAVILNATGFAIGSPSDGDPARQSLTATACHAGPFAASDAVVLQVVFASGSEAAWDSGTNGLGARDIAMNIALPEVDGRVFSRAVSFKAAATRDAATEIDLIHYQPRPDRIAFTAALAARWARLRTTDPARRRIGLVLSNYPNRDGRMGNGVGLDTPAATVDLLSVLAGAGYDLGAGDRPESGSALMALLREGVTNDLDARSGRLVRESLPLPDYLAFFRTLDPTVQQAVTDRWGTPEQDPHFQPSELSCGGFALAILCFGRVAVGVQPARGYNIDPVSSYHDPALVPPHGYFAFYAWLREAFAADAVIHLGKHGTLEWLPGKSLALSERCFPEAVLGPMPHLYPFIVNDPGEGTQAKRRAQAVIIDHLTPPLTRAESYGPLRDLELLVDEYYEAAGVDPRRLKVLRQQILDLSRTLGLDQDVGITSDDNDEQALSKLDNHLCDLKELQIRDGLHIFGRSPVGQQRLDLLVALARVPGSHGISLHRALARDLGLEDFDPLDCAYGDPWSGARPVVLASLSDAPWRSQGDTVERLELLASALVAGEQQPPGPASAQALEFVHQRLMPAVDVCGAAERAGLLRGLDGRFVPPGASGAPTRGRPDVLPTGRNFYSVDTRVVPTPAAWSLGWASAQRLLDRHAQDHGEWPTTLALTAWGTSNMRTGGDDIAQGLALMGVKPTWDTASRRVTGFEILPAGVLGRPRVDVTLRISGFFRDAFPALIDLFDSAARAVAALDEPPEVNPLAARVNSETARLMAEGQSAADAATQAGHRVFGSKPGAYGAGLQALIDERGWDSADDLAQAYLGWGGYAYGKGGDGKAAHALFGQRLQQVQVVVQNQDNREHDLLDSDDYYQFEGGMTAAVRSLSGQQPVVYHSDHSRPDAPRIRTLTEEIARVVRGRAANPKWIAGVMRHGYKGAFEMAATVDYLFAFQATARCVADHHFDAIFDAYLGDETVRSFLAEHNPAALREMADRFAEAIDRRLWSPRRNSTPGLLDEIRISARD
ncbi:cobaltochelatase subunit CobN [Insolitispirillum peregrinum]|uniref:cobaltochelatase subunit CobN n=1 Tax=Insolitispirillum peregrinum TaxID=80876 RepID=UPI0036228D3D